MATKTGGGGNIQENYDPNTGKYISGGSGGNSSSTNNKKSGGSSGDGNIASSASSLPSFLIKKKSNNDSSTNTPGFLSKRDDSSNTGQKSKFQKLYEKLKKERFFKDRKLRDEQGVVDNIEKFIVDDDVLSFLEKYGLKTTNPMGAGKTSHSSINTTLTNIIANKMFNPLNVLEATEFDALLQKAKQQINGNVRNVPYAELGHIQRGFNNKNIIDIYLGNQKSDVILPNGVHGSCIYTAYDRGTASGYGRYIMNFVIDNKNANIIRDSDYNVKLSNLKKKIPEMKQKIYDSLIAKGKDSTYSSRVAQIFDNTLNKDYTFGALLMGYDAVYRESVQYCLLLNFKNAYVKKDW